MPVNHVNGIFKYVSPRFLTSTDLNCSLYVLDLTHNDSAILRAHLLHLLDQVHALDLSLLSMITVRVLPGQCVVIDVFLDHLVDDPHYLFLFVLPFLSDVAGR
jgi:hypothetical protein